MACLRDEPPLKVSELIDSHSATWDIQKLQANLLPMDVEIISNIPLSTRRQEDFWAWHYDKRGIFTVRSAYHMLVTTREKRTAWLDEHDGSSDSAGEKRNWSMLWKVRVPSKIRVFLWRLARQSLPSVDVLHHRHMAPHSSCAICGAPDSWRHSLLECNMARCVWALGPEDITELIVNIQEPHARGWLAAVFHALPHEELTRVTVTLWALWHARRKAIHEGIFQSPLSTHSFIEKFVADLDLAKETPKQLQKTPEARTKWIPPPAGKLKVNVDAATSKNSPISSIAAVARRDDGVFLGASSVVLHGITDPETLEALACREGLALAADLHLQQIRLASDCSNVIRSLTSEGMSSYGHVIQEIKARASSFGGVEFVHEGRSANVDAHGLARGSIASPVGRYVWLLSPPDGVCMMHNID